MKKMIAALAVLALVTAPAAAQTSFHFNTGLTMPTGDVGDVYKSGFNLGGTVEFGFGSAFSVEGALGYNRHSIDQEGILAQAGVSGVSLEIEGGNATVITAMVNGKLSGPRDGKVQGYVSGGAGLFRAGIGDVSIQGVTIEGESEAALGVNVGGGVRAAINDAIGVFGDVGYVIGFTEDSSTKIIPIRAGVTIRTGS